MSRGVLRDSVSEDLKRLATSITVDACRASSPAHSAPRSCLRAPAPLAVLPECWICNAYWPGLYWVPADRRPRALALLGVLGLYRGS